RDARAGARGEGGQQRPIGTRQPARAGPGAHALEGMPQPQGDGLTGPEGRLRLLGDGAQWRIDLVEQCRDTLPRGHAALFSWAGWHAPSRAEADDDSTSHTLAL